MTRITILSGSPPIIYVSKDWKGAKQHIILIHTGAEITNLLAGKALCGTPAPDGQWTIHNGPSPVTDVCKTCMKLFRE
jgi:hypothetical protein